MRLDTGSSELRSLIRPTYMFILHPIFWTNRGSGRSRSLPLSPTIVKSALVQAATRREMMGHMGGTNVPLRDCPGRICPYVFLPSYPESDFDPAINRELATSSAVNPPYLLEPVIQYASLSWLQYRLNRLIDTYCRETAASY